MRYVTLVTPIIEPVPCFHDNSMNYDLLSSTRCDAYLERLGWNNHNDQPSRFLLLSFHVDRLRDAAVAHDWPDAQQAVSYDVLLDHCQAAVASYDGDPAQAFKIRITLSRAGLLTAAASPLPPLKFDPTSPSFSKPLTDSATLYGPAMTLFLDTQPTPPSGLFTSTKTTHRTIYDTARARVGLSPLYGTDSTDVILYDDSDHITEASIFNVAFYHAHNWVTPPLSTGCLPGVLRRWLLQHKRIREAEEGELTKAGLRPGDWVLLFNSVHGCRLGRITAS
ncbi:aminotransferase class IV-domain-containing protein [Mycena crocata]|nr:aminotransferase class IV-domain-containing protein [Mycena crocata]